MLPSSPAASVFPVHRGPLLNTIARGSNISAGEHSQGLYGVEASAAAPGSIASIEGAVVPIRFKKVVTSETLQ
jgi:hypothetical protein